MTSPRTWTPARAWSREAAASGAKLIGLPENFAYLGSDRDHRLSLAERVGGDERAEPDPRDRS